jgi:uncharacterized protein YbjT (DUF2867 family)
MADTKIIAVMGATGAQGGGLVRAIQADPASGFIARAITRDANSDAAKQLAALGAEIVEANIDDGPSIARAFEGAHGAFCVTFYWAHMNPEREIAEAHTLADAAKQAGVKHAIWSTLEDTRKWVPLSSDQMPTIHDHYKVPHFDTKGESNRFFHDVPTTYLLTSFYWDNLINFGMNPKPDGQGGYVFALPMDNAKLPGIAAEDIGRSAYGIFKQGDAAIGKTIGIAGEHLTGAEMAAALSEVLGINCRHLAISPADYRALGFPGADDLGNMFQFKRDFEADFRGPRDVAATRALDPELQDFRAYLTANKDRIPLT